MSETSLLARLLDEEFDKMRRDNRRGSVLTRKQIVDYSLTRVLEGLSMPGGGVKSGLETELHRSNLQANRESGGLGFFVPFDAGLGGQRFTRDLTVNNYSQGGALVGTEFSSTVVPLFRNRTVALRLGATVIEGLRGNFVLPRQTSPSQPQALAEIAPVASSSPTFDQLTLSPKRFSARLTFSRQLVFQSSISIESFLRKELFDQLGVFLDSMILNGQGASSQPLGLMQTPGIGSVTFGGVATWANVLAFEQSLAAANADVAGAKMGWVSTPATRNRWKAVAKNGIGVTSVVPIFLLDPGNWGDDSGDMVCDGYRFATTNNMPNNQVLFGNWDECIVGIWGDGIYLTPDPYTSAATDEINLTAVMYADVAAKHGQSFCTSADSGAL